MKTFHTNLCSTSTTLRGRPARWFAALALLSISAYAPSAFAETCETCPPPESDPSPDQPAPPPAIPKTPLQLEIDALVEEVLDERKLPGITLSITRHGKPIYAEGYGLADVTTYKPMTADTRARIGSVSKAIVTGPTGFRMLEQRQIEPSTQRVYGPTGLLGNTYASDQAIGIGRHQPIIEMDIAADDKVYTWYQNRTVSVGASNDLDKYQAPKPFTMPQGMGTVDLRGIAIASNNTVYSWFEDANGDPPALYWAVGTSTDLDAYGNGGQQKVKMPAGYSAHDVVGIAIAKSNDHVYIWYADGKVSSGTSTDFTYYFEPKDYTVAPQINGSPYHIRGMGIASNDKVYTWFSNGKATIGTSTDLDHHYPPYAYTIPVLSNLPNWSQWYSSITVQHLLDHRSGFTRSSEPKKAAELFGVSAEAVNYRQIHQHFLRTRKLLSSPGSNYSYANAGFGLWTLLIEAATGIDFETYARNYYLKPFGLDADIQAQGDTHDSRDATNYVLKNGKFEAVPIVASGTGLAAGGYRASARGLTKAMWAQTSQYSYTCLTQMGWAVGDGGELNHFGALDGGMSFVTMYPNNYTSTSGKNLGGLHIALVANRWAVPSRFDELRDAIAEKVAGVNVQAPLPVNLNGNGFELSCQSQ